MGALVKNTSDAQTVANEQGGSIEVFGNPDQLKLLFKVQGVDWKKSTKALPVPGGCHPDDDGAKGARRQLDNGRSN